MSTQWVSVDDTLSLWLPAPAPAPRPPPRVIHCKDYISAVGIVRTDPSKAYACQSVGPYLLAVALRECVQFYSLHQSESELVVLETGMEASRLANHMTRHALFYFYLIRCNTFI
jgi:hypothetical protein